MQVAGAEAGGKGSADAARKALESADGKLPSFVTEGSDIIFTLWVNRPPIELANDMVPFKRGIDEPLLVGYSPEMFPRQEGCDTDSAIRVNRPFFELASGMVSCTKGREDPSLVGDSPKRHDL